MIAKIIFFNIWSVNTQKSFEKLIEIKRWHNDGYFWMMNIQGRKY